MPGFQRRRRRTEDQRNAESSGPPIGHVAGVVARGFVLFERAVVLFVQYDQAEIGRRCKNRAASADDDLDIAGGNLLPVPGPLGGGQMRMQYRDAIKPGAESLPRLRGQADFGNQHDRLPTKLNHFLNRANVDFGFAAAGDPVHQESSMRVRFDVLADGLSASFLFRIENQIGRAFLGRDLVGFCWIRFVAATIKPRFRNVEIGPWVQPTVSASSRASSPERYRPVFGGS